MTFQAALIDKAAGPYAFDLLEYRAGARMPFQPRVLPAAPAEILLQDPMDRTGIAAHQLERRREDDVLPVVEDGIVVAELHIIFADGLAFTFFGQDVARLEDLGDEHRALALRRRRQEVEILPDRAANGARNADVMLDSRPAKARRLLDEGLHDRAAFRAQLS